MAKIYKIQTMFVFFGFLKKNGYFEKFKNNFLEQHPTSYSSTFQFFDLHPNYYVNSIIFSQTKEGIIFWEDVSRKWCNFLSSDGKKIIEKRVIEIKNNSVKSFIRFLKNKKIYNRFLTNYLKNYYNEPFSFMEKYDLSRIIYTFNWASTKEGFYFWHKVDLEWTAFLKNTFPTNFIYDNKKEVIYTILNEDNPDKELNDYFSQII